jgi:hypothetical protein
MKFYRSDPGEPTQSESESDTLFSTKFQKKLFNSVSSPEKLVNSDSDAHAAKKSGSGCEEN